MTTSAGCVNIAGPMPVWHARNVLLQGLSTVLLLHIAAVMVNSQVRMAGQVGLR